jgi:hypothetical protein
MGWKWGTLTRHTNELTALLSHLLLQGIGGVWVHCRAVYDQLPLDTVFQDGIYGRIDSGIVSKAHEDYVGGLDGIVNGIDHLGFLCAERTGEIFGALLSAVVED